MSDSTVYISDECHAEECDLCDDDECEHSCHHAGEMDPMDYLDDLLATDGG